MGYLDRSSPSLPDLLPILIGIEARACSSKEYVAVIRAASATATHVVPSYSIVSKPMTWKPWSWLRKVLVEELYGRARVVFPDRVNAPNDVDDK